MAEIRDKAREGFRKVIQKGIDKGRINKLSKAKVDKFAENLELGIFNYAIARCKECGKRRRWEEPAFKEYYKEQYTFIKTNLDVDKNKTLLIRLVKEEFTCDELCAKKRLDEETQTWIYGMSSKEILNVKDDKDEKDEKGKKKREGLFKCKFCKSHDTTYYQQQTRSGDEAMTNFVTCYNCGKQFKA